VPYLSLYSRAPHHRGLIAVVIGFTLLPIWPDAAKKVLWYISVTVLIAMLALCLIRFVLFLLLWILGYEFWIFPRLFDETLSFQDSFKPVYTFEKGTPGQGYYRVGLVIGLIAFVAWACTKPTEFDGFLQTQKDFINDLYNGNLLADVAQEHKDNLDRTKKGPTLEDLLREEEEERREIEAAKKIEDLHAGGLAADQDEMDAEEAAARMDKMLEEEED
jgi:translocation protein SEC62